MKNIPQNPYNHSHLVSFKGKSVPDAETLKIAHKFINCGLKNLEQNLVDSIGEKAPNLLRKAGDEKYILDDTLLRRFTSSLKSFFGMPLDIVDAVAKKFPNSSLNNAKFLQKYRGSVQFENEVRALQGLQSNGIKFVHKVLPDGKYPQDICDSLCKKSCSKVIDNYNKLLNTAMADDKAVYDTKKERFLTRLVSGFTAAMFLGNDFYNKSIQKGKTKEEAKREQHLKQGQEIKENICEAITQFVVFACFSKLVNKSVWSSAVIGAVIGLVSRVVSRLSSGMPIRRIKAPVKNNTDILSMDEYIKSAKAGKVDEAVNKKQKEKYQEKHKKPLLSAKNILLFCSVSIITGYVLRFLKGHTKTGQSIAKKLQDYTNKFNSATIEEKYASKKSLAKMADIINDYDCDSLAEKILSIPVDNKTEKAFLGTDFKTTKLFGIEVKLKDLKRLKTAPFRFVKELVSYPFKIVSKLESAFKSAALKDAPKTDNGTLLHDKYGIMNLYKRYTEFEKKYVGNDKKLKEEFGKYLRKIRLLSNNNVTSSSCNNSKIAVLAQTLGTLTGMWFNMNDEYNSSIRNGSSVYTAQKDARLRGINKFFRMTVQLIISGSLNDIFQKQYNGSLAKSAVIVAVSTVLTDMASRVLTGMPNRKMTKEELEQYQNTHKKGIMSAYYKLIDKLAS